jgi:hypothetical protein
VLFYYIVHLLLLCRETSCKGFGSWSDLPFTFQPDHKEEKSLNLRNHLSPLLREDQRDYSSRDFLQYPIDLTSQSDTTRPKFIKNMKLPHIWLTQKNITNFKRGVPFTHIYEWKRHSPSFRLLWFLWLGLLW